ncbi:unnamed protein product [Rhizoctonia solani]|uniref:Uncharacterized protein n=1 Tax=Rhizoctonia solani TaxID=456999 RepID=A0A8H2XPN9_9AGAM|nr:unnamed protein product [Rhizoctonia solani]
MSNSQPVATKKTKRPRGLLASRKNNGHTTESEPPAKRPRGDDALPQDSIELKAQDWQDLDELFENVLDALHGPNWTSAIPLVRGVLHECARMVTVYNDPTLIYSPLEQETLIDSEKVPASAFYTIYASAWFIMSTFARNDASLLTEDEPQDPLEYQLSALAACEKGQQALDIRKQPKAWDLEFIRGRALVAAAQSSLDSDDQPQASENGAADARAHFLDPDSSAALGRALGHLTYAFDQRPRSTDSSNGIEAEQKSKDERFVLHHLEACRKLLHRVEDIPVSEELRIQLVLHLGQIDLAIGSNIAERLEDESNDKEPCGDEAKTRATATQSLKEAIAQFDTLQEALVTLAILLPEGPEQEGMYSRYQAEGGVLEDEDEEE